MQDIKKLLKTLVEGQTFIFEELKQIKSKVNENGDRIKKLGLQLAALEDDAPTMEDHDELAKRVDKLEEKVASI